MKESRLPKLCRRCLKPITNKTSSKALYCDECFKITNKKEEEKKKNRLDNLPDEFIYNMY